MSDSGDVQIISLTVEGNQVEVPASYTGIELFKDQKNIVALRVDGELKDLATKVTDLTTATEISGVDINTQDGINILRHSCTHVIAQAVQQLRPEAKIGIGPFIEDGFYYDFGQTDPFTPEDLRKLEKIMARIIKEGQLFKRRVVSEAEALNELGSEPYKVEIIQLAGGPGSGGDEKLNQAAQGAAVEVGGTELTIYDNVRRNGDVAWRDLCRGPHLPNTRILANGFAITKVSASYWRGDQARDSMQRIYGTAWPTKEQLAEYQYRISEAEKRDHRRIGTQLDLFSFPEEIGSGIAVFHPKGALVRMEMENYARKRHLEAGYSFVYTPHITKSNLFEVSGHLDFYADGMYPPMHIDEERDAEGNVTKQGADYYLKPMNCPMHNIIYRSRGRSYRELPLRLFEFGTVYRNEKSGVVHGLTRARGFTQDDSHIYCTREQMHDELASLLNFVLNLLKDYGINDFYLEISTKNPNKYVGDDELWEEATNTLAEVAAESGLKIVPDPQGAAFYGPKISVKVKDAMGREWQMSTIQLDFNLPERFDLEYTAADGTRKRPVMIHRALFGAIERFLGVIIEHYAGAFPAWLAPTQVIIVPVAEAFFDYCEDVAKVFRQENVRVDIDLSSDRFGKKIRNAAIQKVPFVIIVGGDDVEAQAVSFRYRDGRQENQIPLQTALDLVKQAIENKAQV